MVKLKPLIYTAIVGFGAGLAYRMMKHGVSMSAEEGNSSENNLFSRIQDAVNSIRPSQLEELEIERSGTAMEVYPQSFDPAFLGSYNLASQTATRTLNMTAFGPGVIDFEVRSAEAYGTTLSAEDFQVNSVGQEALPSNQVPMAYTYPQMMGAPCRLPADVGMTVEGAYPMRPDYPSNRQGDFARLSTVYMTTDTLGPDMNVSYTDGSQTMSFEEWRRNYNLTPVSDTTFQAISKNGGPRLMIRRV